MTGTTAQNVPASPLPVAAVAPHRPISRRRRQHDFGFAPEKNKIMIVDDEELNIDLVKLHLDEAGYQRFCTTSDPRQALDLIRRELPDVVLLDLMMPHVSGFEILAAMDTDELWQIPVIMLTASNSAEAKLQALELGAADFLAKPVDASELLLRLKNTLTAKALQDHLRNYSQRLRQEVLARTAQLEGARKEALYCLARAAEFRDDDTGRHVVRVGRFAAVIASRLGFDQVRVDLLDQAAQLHDVGKIGISDTILLKEGPLTHDEFELMKTHCEIGSQIIQPLADHRWSSTRTHCAVRGDHHGLASSPVMRLAAVIAETHHEHWDGTGYPRGLAEEQIPIEGRITAVADVFDALSSKRPYKTALPLHECFAIMEEGRAAHFDPRVLDAFFSCYDEIVRIKTELADPE